MKQKITFALTMGIITTGMISFILIYMNIGQSDKFPKIWLRSWGLSYLLVIPIILGLGPIVQKGINRMFEGKKK